MARIYDLVERRAPVAVTDGDTILATADLRAGPGLVFAALTTVEVEKWWGSDDTYQIKNWQADVRVGGRWSLNVDWGDGKVARHAGGRFLEIDWPHRFVITRIYEWKHPTLANVETKVTFQMIPITPGTRLTIRHDGFAGRQADADEHAYGWERFLGWLDRYISLETG